MGSTRLVLLVVVLAAVTAACGDGLGAEPRVDVFADEEPETPVAVLERVGGFVAPEYELIRLPDVVVYADGSVLAARDDGGFSVLELADAELRRLGRDLHEADLGRFPAEVEAIDGAANVVDADAVAITVRIDGREHRISAYALGLEEVRYPEPVESVAARLQLLAERAHAEGESWIPERGRLMVTGPASPDVPAGDWPEQLPVPDGLAAASLDDPATVVLEGEQIHAAMVTFGSTATRPFEIAGGQGYVVSWRPLLPHEVEVP